MEHIANDSSQSHKKKVINNTQEIHKRKRKHHDWSHFASPIWDDFPSNTKHLLKVILPKSHIKWSPSPWSWLVCGILSSTVLQLQNLWSSSARSSRCARTFLGVFCLFSFTLQWKSLKIPRIAGKGRSHYFWGWRTSDYVVAQQCESSLGCRGVGGQLRTCCSINQWPRPIPVGWLGSNMNGNRWDLALSDQGRFPLSA